MKKGFPILITAVFGAIICSVIRFFQYVTILDFDTGFFTIESGFAGTMIYVALAVFGAAAVFLAIFGSKRGWTAATASSDGLGSKATLVQGICWLAAAAIQCFGFIGSSGITLIGGIISAASLAIIGFILLKNSVPPKAAGLLNLIPALCLFLHLTNFFRADIIIKNHSESLILLLGYVCGVLFLSSMARFFARLETKYTRSREIISACLTLILTLTHIIAKTLGIICGGENLAGMGGIDPTSASLAVLSLGWLSTVCCFSQRKSIEFIDEKNDVTEEGLEKK